MQLLVAAVGQRMPAWVNEAWHTYTRRMPTGIRPGLREIPLARRGRNADTRRLKLKESQTLQAAMPKRARVIAMDIKGRQWSTQELAQQFGVWMADGRDLGIMIGGPDGIDKTVLDKTDICWSLGPPTFPHPLVRVMLAEQLYRAWTITQNHPYHRA